VTPDPGAVPVVVFLSAGDRAALDAVLYGLGFVVLLLAISAFALAWRRG